ncbi:MAG: NAD-dependent epimerase/dehydratase family protein [Acidimicrobiia bacterium]|nr:NAD-dependent epimerase/dehydratase family protein [Acidimicrobiia bacterium]
MTGDRVLVTGGAGFLGSHLVDRLCDAGNDVTVLDDLSTGDEARLALRRGGIRFVEGSVLDAALVGAEVARADLVYHLAAAVGVRNVVDRPLTSLLTNARGTEHVLAACFEHGAKVLLASTSEIYGKTTKLPMAEDDDRVLGSTRIHRWGYSTTKAFDEHLAFAYADQGLPVVVVRYFNSYGPRLAPGGYGSVVANFLRQATSGEPLTVHGDGEQTRCFTYVDDTVRGTQLAATTPAAEGSVLNLGSTRETTVLELAELVRSHFPGVEIVHVPHEEYYGSSYEDTRRRVPDVTRARDVLGWEPAVDLPEGLARTVEWWRGAHA